MVVRCIGRSRDSMTRRRHVRFCVFERVGSAHIVLECIRLTSGCRRWSYYGYAPSYPVFSSIQDTDLVRSIVLRSFTDSIS